MERTEIKTLFENIPENDIYITVAGWVKTSIESKNLAFLELNDGSCFKNLQVILESSKFDDESNYKKVANAAVGSAVIVYGKLILTPDAKQPFELNADNAEIVGVVEEGYPLQKKRMTPEFLRQFPHYLH